MELPSPFLESTLSRVELYIPYFGKLTLHEIKVLEINANLMENEFRINKINAKEENFTIKEI